MFQWAVSLEITGACPAPGRFSSELLNPVSRACDFQRYQVSLATHSPNGKTDSMPGCMFQQPNALVQRFPSFRWLAGIRFPNSFSGPDSGWSRRRCTWTPQSEWWQKYTMFKNSLQNITCQQVVLISMFFSTDFWLPLFCDPNCSWWVSFPHLR